MLAANDSVNGQWTYEYGPLNRLLEACSPNCASPATALQYVYDRFGNRWQENVLAGGGPSAQLTCDADNRIIGASYDASGDLLAQGSNTFTYDAEGRIASGTASGGAIQYVYDAFGRRVEKVTSAGTFYYLHDLFGRPVTELTSSGGFNRGEIYAGGRHLATYANNTTIFDYADWLGTERMRATITGYEQEACASLPYGANLSCTGGTDYSPMHFTGQVRDAATGLDHFPARYYTSSWGLFTTPDDGSAQSVTDGQSWDLYGYARDNPATLTDPSGRDVRVCVTTGRADAKQQTCTVMSDEQYHKLYEEQNGKQEIQMPGGTFPSGNITCGGKVCGSAQYFEPGMQDQSLNLFAMSGLGDLAIGGLRAGAAAAEDIVGAVARFAEDAPAAASGAAEAGAPLVTDPAEVAAKASSAVGNQSITVPDRATAERAVDEFLGPDKQPALDRQTGVQVGWKSADGSKVVIGPHTDADGLHLNFKDTTAGSNLHVRW